MLVDYRLEGHAFLVESRPFPQHLVLPLCLLENDVIYFKEVVDLILLLVLLSRPLCFLVLDPFTIDG